MGFPGEIRLAMGNVHLDRSPAMPVTTKVTGKYMSKGKTPQPMLQLSLGGDGIPREIRIRHERYRQAAVGDTLALKLHTGFFATPWVELD